MSFLNDQDSALDGYTDCHYVLNIGSAHLPDILIGIRKWPNKLVFICMFWGNGIL